MLILLGGLFKLSNNRSPAEAFADIPNKRAYDKLEARRFIARHQLMRFQFNPHFPVNTLKIMRLAVATQALECGPQTIEAMYSAIWEQARNMDDSNEIAPPSRKSTVAWVVCQSSDAVFHCSMSFGVV